MTLLRLVLIPIPCWLLYQGTSGQYAALIFATLLGCTDFVDGYLARKHGPTVLGGLMDPIADKVFIAITFLPAVDLHWAPAWLVAALFVREFVVTAARTSYEARGQQLKSSYLARYKTWAQMCGIGMLMLMFTVQPGTLRLLLAIGALTPLLFYVVRLIVAKKRWKGASAFAASFALLLLTDELVGSRERFALGLMYFIVAITWASGLGYLSGVGKLRGKGAVTGGELVRLLTAAALPLLAVWAQTANLAPKWAIIALVSIELAHGGLDSLLAHHHAQASGLAWGARLFAECGLLAVALLVSAPWAPSVGAIAAALVGAVGLVVAFVQNRRLYLDSPPSKRRVGADDAALSA